MLAWQGRLRERLAQHTVAPVGLPVDACCESDLAYGDDPAQQLDVYRLRGASTGPTAPILMLVHGGAWTIGDKTGPRLLGHKVAHWLPKGYVVVSVNYRLLPEADPVQQAADLACALAFVQCRAASWGADAGRLVLMGHSTGAHLAALLAADAELTAAHGVQPWMATILLDSAALDVEQTMRGPHLPLHDRAFGRDLAFWRQASPLHRLQQRPAPMLLIHAAARAESARQAMNFAAAAVALGGRAEVLSVALSHADINALLGNDPVYTNEVDTFLVSIGLP